MKKIMLLFFVCSFAAMAFAQEKPNTISEKAQNESLETEKIDKVSKVNQTNATNTVVSYDFTTGSNQYYGGTDAAVEVEPGVWAMIAGDANGDGTVNAIDFNDHWLPQNGTAYSYDKTADFNLDATINAIDYNTYWLANNGKATQVP